MRIVMRPIGFVRTKAGEEEFKSRRRNVISQVVVDKKYSQGLKGIKQYSHLFIIFWLHKVNRSERRELLVHPKHRMDLPEVGVFSTRHRNHPNPIGLTVVKLLDYRSRVLRVRGLDAADGTPVLDIKPYDHYDIEHRIKVPQWWIDSIGRRPPVGARTLSN